MPISISMGTRYQLSGIAESHRSKNRVHATAPAELLALISRLSPTRSEIQSLFIAPLVSVASTRSGRPAPHDLQVHHSNSLTWSELILEYYGTRHIGMIAEAEYAAQIAPFARHNKLYTPVSESVICVLTLNNQ